MLFFAFPHARQTDFRRGKKLGIGDHQVVWHRPYLCPKRMSQSEFAALPSMLLVREVYLRLRRRGFRDQNIIVVTTLLDAKQYSAWQLTQLYGLRWQAAEVNLRHLKTTLNMEMLTAKTPEMVRKEIWTHLLSYTSHANPNVGGDCNLRTHPFSTLTPRGETVV